jgi:hypothetical protein
MHLLGEEPLDAEQPAAAADAGARATGGADVRPPAADLVAVPDARVHAQVEAPDAAAQAGLPAVVGSAGRFLLVLLLRRRRPPVGEQL